MKSQPDSWLKKQLEFKGLGNVDAGHAPSKLNTRHLTEDKYNVLLKMLFEMNISHQKYRDQNCDDKYRLEKKIEILTEEDWQQAR